MSDFSHIEPEFSVSGIDDLLRRWREVHERQESLVEQINICVAEYNGLKARHDATAREIERLSLRLQAYGVLEEG